MPLTPLSPLGCDTFVAYPPSTKDGTVIFGKNSDRPVGEGQSIRVYPARRRLQGDAKNSERGADDDYSNDCEQESSSPTTWLQCTYIRIHDEESCAVLLSQIDWMWGAEMGANEHGVVIGNEAVWTRLLEREPTNERRLLGMDLVRLGLERSTCADEALEVITTLLARHGQGGPCAHDDEDFTYHNSFLIADAMHAWVLETAGEHWVAQKITRGSRNISNGLTIRADFDRHSLGLHEYAKQNGFWDGTPPLDFARCFSSGGLDLSIDSRQACGRTLLSRHDDGRNLDAAAMMAILRDHGSGICMHGDGFETTASMVSEIFTSTVPDDHGESTADGKSRRSAHKHWMTGKSFPCRSEFVLQPFP